MIFLNKNVNAQQDFRAGTEVYGYFPKLRYTDITQAKIFSLRKNHLKLKMVDSL